MRTFVEAFRGIKVWCWVHNQWHKGELISVVPPNEISVLLETEVMPVLVYSEHVLPMADEPLTDDLTELMYVHQPSIVESLRKHAAQGSFSVNAGPHLLQVREGPESHHMLGTAEKVEAAKAGRPHLYQTTAKMYRGHFEAPQALIFHGDSGSGKSRAMHTCMQYLFALSGCGISPVQSKLVRMIHLVEALTCASTTAGVSTSFGTMIVSLSMGGGFVNSAKMELKAFAAVHALQPHMECNRFHVLHQLMEGLSPERKHASLLNEIGMEPLYNIAGLTDLAAWKNTIATLIHELYWSKKKVREFEQLLIIIVHFLQLDLSSRDGSSITELLYSRQITSLAELLSVQPLELLTAVIGPEIVEQLMNHEEDPIGPQVATTSQSSVLAFAGGLYYRMVVHVVGCVNDTLDRCTSGSKTTNEHPMMLIDTPGLLALSGESTMADLAHNYAYEICTHQFAVYEKARLGSLHMGPAPENLAMKQDDLIRWGSLPLDESHPLNLFEKSLLELISEFKHLPIAQQMRTLYAENYSHPSFRRNLDLCHSTFSIKHTGGEVIYNLAPLGMLSHTQDLLTEHCKLLSSSTSELNRALCNQRPRHPGMPVLQSVKTSLEELYKVTLEGASRHHVFMMRPFTSEAQRGVIGDVTMPFDPNAVLEQMQHNKLMQSLGAQVALMASGCLQQVRDLDVPEAALDMSLAIPLAQAVIKALGVIPAQKAMGVSNAVLFGEQIVLIEILARIQSQAAAVALQKAWRSSAAYTVWKERSDQETAQDPAIQQALMVQQALADARKARAAQKAKDIKEWNDLNDSAFKIQEFWRFNRNRRHLAQRGMPDTSAMLSLVKQAVAAVEEGVSPGEPAAMTHKEQLARIESAYQKALQQRRTLVDNNAMSPAARAADALGYTPAMILDHSAIDELARNSPLKVTQIAAQFPAGKYNKKYQRKYAMAQDGTFLETGYNSDDSSASSMTDSEGLSSDDGIDMMTA